MVYLYNNQHYTLNKYKKLENESGLERFLLRKCKKLNQNNIKYSTLYIYIYIHLYTMYCTHEHMYLYYVYYKRVTTRTYVLYIHVQIVILQLSKT